MKRPAPKIRRSTGKWGGHCCDLCAPDANSQPTCKAERENSPLEEDQTTYRCTRKRLHGGDHAACGNDHQVENHPIVTWRGTRTRRKDIPYGKEETSEHDKGQRVENSDIENGEWARRVSTGDES